MADLDKPGCFGFVVTYEPDSEYCKGCAHLNLCAETVGLRRSALETLLTGRGSGSPEGSRTRDSVKPTMTPEAATKETVTVEETTETKRGGSAPKRYAAGEMSKKAQALADSLERMGIDAVGMLKAGKNPMKDVDRLTYFKMACDHLISNGSLDRTKLRADYVDKLGWNLQTANSHMSIIASYLSANGIVAVDGTTYIRVAR